VPLTSARPGRFHNHKGPSFQRSRHWLAPEPAYRKPDAFCKNYRYLTVRKKFVAHSIVRHIEECFSIFKRDMNGVCQHCGHNHLHRDFADAFDGGETEADA